LLAWSRRVEVTGPRGADGSLRANRFGSVATKHEATNMVAMSPRRTAYVVALPDLPGGRGPTAAVEQLAVGLEHLALDWLDADAAPGEARLVGMHQRLVEQTADGELVSRLLAEPGVDPNTAASVYTPLTHAAELGHLEAARLLLDGGGDPSLVAGDGATPLMAAAGGGHLEVLRLLLARGAVVDAVSQGDGYSAFHFACIKNRAGCAEELARAGCDVGIKNQYGRTGCEIAERHRHMALVACLDAGGWTLDAGRWDVQPPVSSVQLGIEWTAGGGAAQAPGAKKKRKKRPKKKRTAVQPEVELEPEIDPGFEPQPQPQPQPQPELELELEPEPEPLLEPEPVDILDDPVAQMDLGARPPTSNF
jgi:hypothetical protein